MTQQGDTAPRGKTHHGWFRSVRGRLTVSFILGFALILTLIEFVSYAGIPFSPYAGRFGEQKAEALRNLDLIADLKKERLHRWLEERRDDAQLCAESDMVQEYTAQLRAAVGRFASELNHEQLLAQLRREVSYRRLADYLDTIRRIHGVYDELLIADAITGRILVSTDETAVGGDVSDRPHFSIPLWSEESHVGQVVFAAQGREPVFHVSHIIRELKTDSEPFDSPCGEPIALLVMKVGTDDIIKPMLHTGEGLGRTGEALLVNQERKILMSLKHPLPDGTIPQPLEYQIRAKPAVFAARGEEGVIDTQDYRGEPVLAAYRHIRITPEWGWGLVVKVDKMELLAPLRRELAYSLSLGLLGVLAFVGLAVFIAGSLTRPLRVLSRTAEMMSSGDRSVRCGLRRRDEIGQLGVAFDSMAASVEKTVAELEESETRIRTIVETALDGIMTIDSRGALESFNPAAERMFGYQAGEVVGKNITVLMPEQHHEAHTAALEKRVLAQETGILRKTAEFIGKRKDGTTFPLELAISEARVGGRSRFTGIVRDITDRKQTEDELKKHRDHLEDLVAERTHDLRTSNQALEQEIAERGRTEEEMRRLRLLLKNMIDSMPSSLVAVDAQGRVTHWNRQAEETTGVSLEEAEGQPLHKVFPAMEGQLAQVREALRHRKTKSADRVESYTNGERHFTDVMVYPLVSNGIDGAVIRVDDVTERVHLEEMMIQSEKMLSVGGLAAGMAHEINNPLSGILQNVQVVLDRISTELPANVEAARDVGINLEALSAYMDRRKIIDMLDSVRKSGKRAAKIVENMLSFARKSDSHFSPLNLSGLIDQTLELAATDYDLKKKFDFKQIEIVREFDPDLPEVNCDGPKIQQVILNLLRNGAQAMAEPEDRATPPRFILRTVRDGDSARIEVEDNGPGMTDEVRKRVFEPFFTTKETGTGTGLGLSVSYFIVTENHGGTMAVESNPGGGARFIVRLPLQRRS